MPLLGGGMEEYMKKGGSNKAKARKTGSAAQDIAISALKGAVVAMVFTILAILVFAFAIKAMSLEDSAIAPVNQAIKIIGIMLAAYVSTRCVGGLKWLRGLCAGLLYVVMGFVIFSLLEGAMGMVSVLVSDMLAGAIIGLAAALLFAALPGKQRKVKA